MRCRLHVCGCLRCRTFADFVTWLCCSIVNWLPKSAMVVVVIAPFRDVIISCWNHLINENDWMSTIYLLSELFGKVLLTSVLQHSIFFFMDLINEALPELICVYCLLITLTCSRKTELRRAQLNGIGPMHVRAPLAAAKRPRMIPEHSNQARCFWLG